MTSVSGYGAKVDSKALDTIILVGGLTALVGIGYVLWKAKETADKVAALPGEALGAAKDAVLAVNTTLNQMGQKTILPAYIQEVQFAQLSLPQQIVFRDITAENKGAATIPDTLAAAQQLTSELSTANAGKPCALNWVNGIAKLECFNIAPQEVTPDVVASVAGIDFVKQCPDGYSRPYFGSECIKGETSALGASVAAAGDWLGSLW